MIYTVTPELQADLDRRFTYHKPGGDQTERYQALRGYARELALVICRAVPDSRERCLALTNLEEAIFWANAGIARNEQHFEFEPAKVELPAGYPPLGGAQGAQPQTVQVEPIGPPPGAERVVLTEALPAAPPAAGESPLSE